MSANVTLLRAVLADIEADPDPWDQADWRACVAARTCAVAGGRWATEPGQRGDSLLIAEPEDPGRDLTTWRGEFVIHARHRAARLLGLDWWQASELFVMLDTDLGKLRAKVAELAGEPVAA